MIRHIDEDISSREMPRNSYLIFNRNDGIFELD
jgi:hypothetical protein